MTLSSQPRKLRIVKQAPRGYGKITRVVFGVPENVTFTGVALDLAAAGLDVSFTASADNARKSAVGRTDTAVVVPVANEAEGDLLATAKIVTALPTAKIIFLAAQEDERVAQFAEFMDAKIVYAVDGPAPLVKAIVG